MKRNQSISLVHREGGPQDQKAQIRDLFSLFSSNKSLFLIWCVSIHMECLHIMFYVHKNENNMDVIVNLGI